ncbi:hypothetical protein FRB99_007801 [Tulasnella sp. 403]|nr:hypothetical protein FRB99_007801 [Tulasnella sp. 403]
MGLLDKVKSTAEGVTNIASDIAKSASKNTIQKTVERAVAEVKGAWNPNHRHDEPHEIEADRIRQAICDSHRFQSFAPERQLNTVKWYVRLDHPIMGLSDMLFVHCASQAQQLSATSAFTYLDYFYAVSELIDAAQECIFIMDWWLSPEIYLRRPPVDFQEWRLDRLLKRKAEQGVKIYVIVFKEVTQALSTSSRHTKNALSELHPNVSVLRHPDHIGSADSVQFWSHHEKVVVVDNHRACVGGLDLCFGRWDNHSHPLADCHPTDFSRTLFPGQDYNNGRVMDFQQVDNYVSNQISILDTCRMPWHDVHMMIVGESVLDIVQHFVERWNEVKLRKYKKDPKYDWLALPHNTEARPNEPTTSHPQRENWDEVGRKFRNRWHEMEDRMDRHFGDRDGKRRQRVGDFTDPYWKTPGTCNVQVLRSVSDWSHGVLTEHSIQNAYIQMIREANHFIYIENQFFISNAGDKGPVQNRIAEALVERILSAARAGQKFKVIVVIPEVPGFAGEIRKSGDLKIIMAGQWRTINRGGKSIYERIRDAGYEPLDYIRFYHLRVYDRINAPGSLISQMEQQSGVSFFDAQVGLARYFIGDDGFWHQEQVKIKRPSAALGLDDTSLGMTEKHSTEEVQSVDFPPSLDAAKSIIRKWESGATRGDAEVSDTVGQHKLMDSTRLEDEMWLGSEQEERDCYVSELLYIHSKLMIVDDRRVIMGSANINDRSQKGDGDSEIAMVVEDSDMIETTMDGKPYMAARFAATLRRRLFKEHLGLLKPHPCVTGKEPITSFMRAAPYPAEDETYTREDQFVADPLSDGLLDYWYSTARVNREIFGQIFRTVPTDNVRNWEQYKKYVPKVKTGHIACDLPLPQVKERLSKIRGALVEAPLNFLIEQPELVKNGDWEGYNPSLPVYI